MSSITLSFKDVFFFNSMLTPKIITFVYWLLLFGVAAAAAGMMVTGAFLQGLAVLFSGVIGTRIWCELMIVLFKINENIQKLADKQ